jgi:hypothetical protein
MPPAKPMLDDVELQHVQKVEAEDEQILAQHGVPALEGDFLQDLGRRVTRFTLIGVMVGPDAGEKLKKLRLKFRNAEPVSFVADIATATAVGKVLIEEFGVRELAGKPSRFEYELTLREFLPLPPSETSLEQPDPDVNEQIKEDASDLGSQQVEDISQQMGTLEVQVTIEGGVQDYTGIVVLVEATEGSGNRVSFLLEEQVNGVYSKSDVPAGEYTASAFRR